MRTGVLATDAGGSLVLRRVLVRVVSGDDRGKELTLEEGTVLIGSQPDADLVLGDRTVSRHHAELALLAEGVRVRDLRSTNGTWVGSARIESILVVPPAEVRFGKTRVELLPADIPAPEVPSERTQFGRLVGASPVMRRLFGVLERIAVTDSALLIEGEAGVGKTEAAIAVHDASPRARARLSVFDLGAPSAASALTKVFEASVGGTVVLERIDEAPAALAAELVALLERRERGGLDVRPIATSRSDLRGRVEEGRVRRDLYFHLAGVRIQLPPLRERLEDLPLLVRHLVESLGYEGVSLSAAELAPLRNRELPGNVRELGRIIEETLLTTRSAHRRDEDGDDPWGGVTDELARLPFKEAKEKLVEAFERQYVAELLERHDGNLSRAAAAADLDRNYLARLAKKHGIR